MDVFVNAFKGKSKKDGKPFTMVRLVRLIDIDTHQYKEFFTGPDLDVANLHFGDEVQTVFEESEFFGGTPRLVKVIKVADSPYNKMLAD